ncbi:MAG: PAS-domain containing protein [Proteobacteria bacterium]|nr:PAS-domain containing protein [Pseudomonadota bacterium]
MNRNARWVWAVAGLAVLGAALVLAFVLALTAASSGAGGLERHFVWLFWVNVAVATLLCLVVGGALLRLLQRHRQGRFGARLLLKLAGIFALVGLLPGLVIYTVSYQFVSRSIESWFDVEVARALDAGLALGKGTLDAQLSQLAAQTLQAAQGLAEQRGTVTPLALERLRTQLDVRELALVGGRGQILLSTAADAAAPVPERPGMAMLRQARGAHVTAQIEGLDEGAASGSDARVRALALLPDTQIALAGGDERFLLAVQAVPPQMAANALAVQAAYSEYQQRALARNGLRRMYIGTLTLALVLAVFAAVLLAGALGNQLVRPLLLLADGVRQVAAGDLRPKPVFASHDELGGLTRSFADMTAQLADARGAVQRGVAQLESARTRLQTILDNLSAGVVLFDRDGRIDTVNPGATRILRLPLSVYRGRPIEEVPELADFAQAVAQRFARYAAGPEAGERDHWQEAYELSLPGREMQVLLVRGAMLPGDARLMVFDDITEVVSAQRVAAWSEVARRLAHEIKNPLTPIQLSAERLQHKLHAKLAGSDAALLERSVGTIVAQVQALKQLVDEFRDYARLPAAQLAPLDLNALVGEVLALYGHEQEQGRLQLQLADALPPVLGDATQLRQVVLNLVQNALDAVAEQADGRVSVSTSAVLDADGRLRTVRLCVLDNGPGFGARVLARAFEPYVTTKTKGTGLGLAVVKKIADEHRAAVRIVNLQDEPGGAAGGTGARVSLSFPNPASSIAPAPAAAVPGGSVHTG